MEKILEKNGRKFIVSSRGGRTVYIGTVACFSNLAAQMLCHKVMEPLNWKTSGTFTTLMLDGELCTAVGYKVPISKRFPFNNPMDYLEESLNF